MEEPVGRVAGKPVRRDVVRNRRRILDAAAVLFAEQGLRARLDDVARRADVGVGTVYRHFGDRDQLVAALFEDQLEEIVQIAEAALEHDDAWGGFAEFMDRMVGVYARSRGVRELMFGAGTGDAADLLLRARGRIEPLVEELVRRAQVSGGLRADLTAADVPLIQIMVGAGAEYTRSVDPEIWRRLVAIMLDGLCSARPGPTQLPVPALDRDQVVSALAVARVAD